MSPYGSSSPASLTAGQSVDGLMVENMASEDEDEPEKWSSAIVKLCNNISMTSAAAAPCPPLPKTPPSIPWSQQNL